MEYNTIPTANEKPFNVNEIKKCLLSRNLPNKISAAKRLFSFLIKNPSKEISILLINADVIEMLCEASCTMNINLLKYIFKCFKIFIEHNQFFQQNRTTFTLESIVRALYVLIKTNEDNGILFIGLQLVCDIICRVNKQNIPLSSICNVPNILNLVRQLFKVDYETFNVYIGTEVVISLLHSQGIIKFKKIVEDSVSEALNVLTDISKKSKDKSCIVIMSEVVNGSMRFLVQPKVESAADASKSAMFMQLFILMKEILVPYLIEIQDTLHESDMNAIKTVLSALLSIYHYPEDPITEEFSHFLVANGFLNFLSSIETQSSNVMNLVILIRSLLFEILQCISNSVLGRANWKNLLLPGFEALPPGGSYKTIFCHDSSEVIPVASIVFNYFNLLSSSNPTLEAELLNALSYYIISLSGIPSAPVTKALWFTFAVGHLCNSMNTHYPKLAMIKLIDFIMLYNIDQVYTHHPALLYWVFCDESVSQELQARIVKYWLDENDIESIEVLKELLIINRESCFVMMELMASESKLSSVIHKLLSSMLVKTNTDCDYIFEHAWIILPQYLAQSSSFTDPLYYEGLTYVMKLCCESTTETLDISLVLRISCLLPGAFSKYFTSILPSDVPERLILDDHQSTVLESTFIFVDYLVQISLVLDDKRVSAVFLKHEAFLKSIEMTSTSHGDRIYTSLLDLLASFILCQKHNVEKSSKIICLEVTKLIRFLYGKTELCIAALRFLALYLELISDKVVLPLVNIPLPTAIQLRTLYFQIHMVCAKVQGDVSKYCWLCLKRLLELSESIGLREHLSTIPYTPGLLLNSSETEAWKEAISFIPAWLPSLPYHSSRALNMPDSVKTLIKLKDKLSKTEKDPKIINALSKVIHISTKSNMIPTQDDSIDE